MNREEAIARFTLLTGGDLGDAENFALLEPDEQYQTIWNYKHMSWAKDPDVGAELLVILPLIANVAADVTGVAGAFAAIKAL